MKFARFRFLLPVLALALPGVLLSLRPSLGQDWLETGINRGAPMVRLAVTELPAQSADQRLVNLTQEFNQALRNDLSNAGIFEMISKSNFPLKIPVEPGDVDFKGWTDPPASTQMLAFGKTEVINENLVVTGRLYDVQNPSSASVLAKRYVATLNEISTREARSEERRVGKEWKSVWLPEY